jgi:hypothetical protein
MLPAHGRFEAKMTVSIASLAETRQKENETIKWGIGA